MKNFIFLFFFLSLVFTGCETVVDLEQSKPKLAVEAIVTDQMNGSYVQLNPQLTCLLISVMTR